MIFKQKINSDKLSLEITEKGVNVEYDRAGSFYSEFYEFEKIGFRRIYNKYNPNPYAIGLFFSVLINLLFVFGVGISIFNLKNPSLVSGLGIGIATSMSVWGRELFRFEKKLFLMGEKNIEFWYFKKDIERIEDFITKLKDAKKNYLRNKHLKFTKDTDLWQMENTVIWLYELEVIDEYELEEWKDRIKLKRILGDDNISFE